jgi:alpha-D-ribose 1-methylphosphonate 5-triphosphate synthase subunit PhnG
LDKQKCLGTVKTKAEAQAIVDAEVQAAQAAWDALSAEEQALRSRPADIVLE